MSQVLRSAGVISAFTFLSRILGLVREQVFAALLGAGPYADAFQAAFRIPNLLRDLFAEGALSAAFVPTYARALREGKDAAFRLASRVLTLLAVVLGALVVAGFVFAEPLVGLLAPGFEKVPGKLEATVLLTRVMLPFLPLVSFAAVAMGMLNAHERYGTPALAPALFNVVAIAWAALLWALGFGPAQVAVGWAVGTLLGGAAQFLVQVPSLWRDGWRPALEWAPGDPAIRAIGRLMAPATVGLAAVQVNIFVSTIFASQEPGAVSWLQYAFRILYLPIGIFGVAVGTVATTGLARRAAEGDLGGVRETLTQSLRSLAFLTVPATVGLMVLSVPIVRLLFERGRFAPADTERTAAALALYATGLVAYTSVKVLAPAFYALGTPRVPLLASAVAVAANLALVVPLHARVGYRVVALGTALGAVANVAVLAAVFEKRVGGLMRAVFGGALFRVAAAAAVMGAVCWWLRGVLEAAFGARGLALQLLTGLGPVAAGGVVYLLLCAVLRVPEVAALTRRLRRRPG
ncbi:MAG TPA: murein biosynthesis integral membrane protein MurJ [Vicinamibacteria bacterium]